jgi:hypothetical protein
VRLAALFLALLLLVPQSLSARFLMNGGASSGSSGFYITGLSTSFSGTVTSGSGTFNACLSAPPTVSGGVPTLPLNTTPTPSSATYTSVSGNCLVFAYSIGTNQSANPAAVTSAGIQPNGATITNGGVSANLTASQGWVFTGVAFAPTGTPASVSSVTCTPATGLLTSTSGSNTATCSIMFNASVTAAGSNVLNLSDGIACPITPATSATLTANCTFTSGSDTPTYGVKIGLSTAASSAISGGTISNAGGAASLANANGVYFQNLQVQTHPFYVVNAGTGSDSNPGSVSQPFLTLAKCLTSMEGGSTKICYVQGGTTYTPASTGTFAAPYQNGANVTVALRLGFGGSTADNNEQWLGFPCTPVPTCLPHISGGATSGSNGVNEFMRLGNNNGSNVPTGVVVNGLVINTFTFGGIATSGAGQVNAWNNIVSGLFNGSAVSGPDGIGCFGAADSYFGATTFAHNVCTGNTGAGIVLTSNNPGTQFGLGLYIVDSNEVGNNCTGGGDCGEIYSYDECYCLPNFGAQVTNNIVWGNTAGNTKLVYWDDYTSGITATGNTLFGTAYVAYFIHAGNKNTFNLNFVDMSSIWPGSFNAALIVIQDDNLYQTNGLIHGYGGLMDNNPFQKNIINTTSAPPSSYINICEQDYTNSGGGSIDFPVFSGNQYWYTGGTGGAFPNYTSSSAYGCGAYTDSSHVVANSQPSFTTDAYGGRHYTFAGTVPSGFALTTNQGPQY